MNGLEPLLGGASGTTHQAMLHHAPPPSDHVPALYAQAQRLYRFGYLPCRPGLSASRNGRLRLTCTWPGPTPPHLRAVPAAVQVRGAFIAWRHATRFGLALQSGGTPYRYTWVSVNKDNPAERMTIWRFDRASGTWRAILRSAVNSGTQHTTPDGSWPIYWRLRTTRMRGTTPSGRHYDLPSVPWVNYYQGNDAIHGFAREFYGFPQSAGCVEMPLPAARQAFALLHVGTVVSVSGRWHWRAGYTPLSRSDTIVASARTPSPGSAGG